MTEHIIENLKFTNPKDGPHMGLENTTLLDPVVDRGVIEK